MSKQPETTDVVVVGAGIAGAATAYFLAKAGYQVSVLERESTFGVHSSGRNAAIGRYVVTDVVNQAMAIEGLRFAREPGIDFERPCVERASGSLTLACGEELLELERIAQQLASQGIACSWLNPGQACARLPLLDPSTFERALWCADDCVLDVHALLHGFLRAAKAYGARVTYGCEVTDVQCDGDVVAGVETSCGSVSCGVLVNAAGAWAEQLGQMAGAAPVGLRVTRRHLMVSQPVAAVDPSWPVVWDVSHNYYLRPESGGLLLSGCEVDSATAHDVQADTERVAEMAGKVAGWVPAVSNWGLLRSWAGLRVLSPDGRFVIGEDPQRRGFVWVAGLGGHGMSAAASVGRLAAAWVAGEASGELAAAMAPSRALVAV